MELSVFSIVMFCFAGGLLIYAGLLAITKDPELIVRDYAAKMEDKKKYATRFARTIAIIAIAPVVSGIAGSFDNGIVNAVVAVVSFVACFIISIMTFKPE